MQGYLSAGVYSDKGNLRNMDLTKGTARFEHGTTYQVVIINPFDLGEKISKVELNWMHDMNVFEPRTLCLFWCNDHLYVKSVTVDMMQMPSREKRNIDFNNKLCAPRRGKDVPDYADIANRGSSTFYNSNCKR